MDPRVVNLTFHGIGEPARALDPGEEKVWIDCDQFGSILDLVDARPDVRLSFDDGNASDVRIALPELLRRKLTAEFYVVAGRLGGDGYLALDDLRRLLDNGMTIGSHGMHHRPWGRLNREDLLCELFEAKDVLEQYTGQPVVRAACPFGDYNRKVLRALKAAGFARVFTSDRGAAGPDDWLQPRNSIARGDVATIERLLWRPDVGLRPLARRIWRVIKRWR